MKRILCTLILIIAAASAHAQRQMENLGRGVVAVRNNGTQTYVGWRMLGTDPDDIAFNLYRTQSGGATVQLTTNRTSTTDFLDSGADLTKTNSYFVRPVINGVEQAASTSYVLPANAPQQQYISIPLTPPSGGTSPATCGGNPGGAYTYNANDCSAADLDGDGEYEIILKWDTTNSKDNAQDGHTGPTYLDAYKLNGTRLWRINLGKNIRSGAHYMDFMVYDFDGDGKAELMCRTAPGTIDGLGTNVLMAGDSASVVYTNCDGYILSGPEYLTVFNGLTGAAMATTNYVPPRGSVSAWGDNYGNRVDRFLAGVAYFDGKRPSAIFCRGYYTRAVLAAWDWRNGQLTQRWVFDSGFSNETAWAAWRGQGAHSLTIGDVDGDGKDEITYGAAAIDDDGTGLYTTGLCHGDALHLSDMDPDRPGEEVWMVHESPSCYGPNGLEYRDARTGALIFGVDGQDADVGRGVAFDIDPRYRGYEMWGARGNLYNAQVGQIGTVKPSQMNFCVWWDADLLREILDDTTISKWNWLTSTTSTLLSPGGIDSNNGTKATPNLSADILGDWREEVIWRASDNLSLRIYTTVIPANNRLYTLMHDPQYRVAIAWQNTGYNQPPHPGFYLGEGMNPPPLPPISTADLVWGGNASNVWDVAGAANWFVNGVWTSTTASVFNQGNSVLFDLSGSNSAPINLTSTLTAAKVTVYSPKDYTFAGAGSLAGTTTVVKAGTGKLTINTTNSYTGATTVSDGALFVNGSLDVSPVTVRGSMWGFGWIGGNGTFGGGVTALAGANIIPGNGTNAAGTLTISNGLTEAGGVVNRIDLSNDPSGTNDLINVLGNVTLTGTNTIALNLMNGPLGYGTYPLIQYTGALSGGVSNLVVTGALGILTNPPGQIVFIVVSNRPPTSIVWQGDGVGNSWDMTSSNWLNGVFPDHFVTFDSVTFDDSGSTNPAVNLSGVLSPAAVFVTGTVNYTFSGGSLTNPASLIKSGSGKLTLTTLNSFTNKTIVLGGTLQLGDGVANNGSVGGGISNNASLIVANPSLLTIDDNITGSGSLTKDGNGTLVLTGTNNYAGTTTILDGTLQIGSSGTSGTLGTSNVINNSILSFSRTDTVTYNSLISGAGSLTVGDGVVALTGSNTYSGGSTVTGALLLNHNNAAGTGSITCSGSTQIGNGITVSNTLNCNGSPDNVIDVPSGTGIFVGNTVFANGSAQFRPGTTGGSLVLSNGSVSLGSRFFFVPRGTVTFAGTYNLTASSTGIGFGRSDGNTANVTIRGSANLSMAGCNMGNGKSMGTLVLTIRDAGQLTVTGGNSFDLLNVSAGTSASTINLAGGTLTVGGFVKTDVGTTLTSTLNFTGGVLKASANNTSFMPVYTGATVRVRAPGGKIDDGGFAITIAQPIFGVTGDGGLTKIGSGTLTLTGTNSYNGGTVVSNGTLFVNNTTASGTGTGAVLVASGATLGGVGIIRGPVTIDGTLAPGSNSVGTLTITNLVLTSGAVMQYTLGTSSDRTTVSSNLTVAGTFNVTAGSGFGQGTYTLFTYGKTLTYSGISIGTVPGGFSYSVSTSTVGQVNLVVGPPLSAFEQWQLQYFGCTNCAQAAGNLDFDGDGLSNTNEFMAGTNPTNSDSALRVISINPAGNDLVISWRTAGGRTNAAQATSGDYNTNFSDISSPIVIGGSGDTTTNFIHPGAVTNGSPTYYRIRLLP